MTRPAVLGLCALARAPTLAWPAPGLTTGQSRGVAQEVIRLVAAHYVFPEARAPMADSLRAALAAGRYDTAEPLELAGRLSEDLAAAGRDKHLWVHHDPAGYRSLLEARSREDASPWTAAAARRRNQGLEEMRILPGNVRYLRVSNFMWFGKPTRAAMDDAARFLRDGDARILDLRGDGGGDPRSVQYLVSHFFDRDQLLMTFDDRMDGSTSRTRVLRNLPGGPLPAVPLYVLTDGGTASAAEEFAYHVRLFHLGTLVGRTTAGAANNNSLFPVEPDFVVSVSTGRPVHPVSGGNWEGTGIAPDVACDPAAALEQAQLLALERLAAQAEGGRRDEYEWVLAGLRGRLHPAQVPAGDLAAYSGHYGIRTLRVEGGALVYQREDRDPMILVPLAPDLFAFPNTDQLRLRFRRDGDRVVGLDLVTADGQVVPGERTD